MQLLTKVSLAAAILLSSSPLAAAPPASRMLALSGSAPTLQRTALPVCSRKTTTNCAMPGSNAVGVLPGWIAWAGAFSAVAATVAVAASSGGSNSASP